MTLGTAPSVCGRTIDGVDHVRPPSEDFTSFTSPPGAYRGGTLCPLFRA